MVDSTDLLIEQLLNEEESSCLDFKVEQYRFVGANADEKSELLKDILAFANAWRREDAFILIGVEEIKGGRSIPHGVSQHIDDASLQEFVNSKTNRLIDFSYSTVAFEGVQLGLIRIPTQDRPSMLVKNYGRLQANAVYIRRGTSTDLAELDETIKMAKTDAGLGMPSLELAMVTENNELCTEFNIRKTKLVMPENIPDYTGRRYSWASMPNHDYYRQFAQYFSDYVLLFKIRFAVLNESRTLASDVRVVLRFPVVEGLEVRQIEDIPSLPSTDGFLSSSSQGGLLESLQNDVHVDRVGSVWEVRFTLSKVQPDSETYTEQYLWLGSLKPAKLQINADIFADQLQRRTSAELLINIEVDEKKIPLQKLIDWADKLAKN